MFSNLVICVVKIAIFSINTNLKNKLVIHIHGCMIKTTKLLNDIFDYFSLGLILANKVLTFF